MITKQYADIWKEVRRLGVEEQRRLLADLRAFVDKQRIRRCIRP
jgi:hypothetical protein